MFKSLNKKISNIKKRFQNQIKSGVGIDLGTANTLVYVQGRGIVINEPSIVAYNTKTNQVVAIGNEAKEMLGKTPAYIKAQQPIVDGTISDFELAQEMLSYLIDRALSGRSILGTRVVIGVPSGITNVDIKAVEEASRSAGAKQTFVVEEPMAAAVGIGLPVHKPKGVMIVDIGGGTTDIGVISLGGLVNSKNIKIAGDKLDEDIINYIRSEFKIQIGKKTAEEVKKKLASVKPLEEKQEAVISGRYLVTGLPKEVVITDSDIREAIMPSVKVLLDSIKEVLETTPPEIVGDIIHTGIHLTGGGALIKKLDEFLQEELEFPVKKPEDPLTAVVTGTAKILENPEFYKDALITHENVFKIQ